VVLDSAKV